MLILLLFVLLFLILSSIVFSLLSQKERSKFKKYKKEVKQDKDDILEQYLSNKIKQTNLLYDCLIPRCQPPIEYNGSHFDYVIKIPESTQYSEILRFMCINGIWTFLHNHLKHNEKVIIIVGTKTSEKILDIFLTHYRLNQLAIVYDLSDVNTEIFDNQIKVNKKYFRQHKPSWNIASPLYSDLTPAKYVIVDKSYLEQVSQELFENQLLYLSCLKQCESKIPKDIIIIHLNLEEICLYDAIDLINGATACITRTESEVLCLSTQAKVPTLCLGGINPIHWNVNGLSFILSPSRFYFKHLKEFCVDQCLWFLQDFI